MPRHSGPNARPTVKRIELDPDIAQMVRNACIIRYGTAGKQDVAEYVNSLLRNALKPQQAPTHTAASEAAEEGTP